MIDADERIGVVVGSVERAKPDDAVLPWSAGAATPGHAPGCLCCRPRGHLAVVLTAWYLDRVRGGRPLPRRLLIVAEQPQAASVVARELDADVLSRARFRYDGAA